MIEKNYLFKIADFCLAEFIVAFFLTTVAYRNISVRYNAIQLIITYIRILRKNIQQQAKLWDM